MFKDPLTGILIDEGELEGREFSDDYVADYFDRDLFTSFYAYAQDGGLAKQHNSFLYERSAQKIDDEFKSSQASGPKRVSARSQRTRLGVQSNNQKSAAAMRAGGGRDYDGSTPGGNVHNLLLRRNTV
jgi:hypothetical protein